MLDDKSYGSKLAALAARTPFEQRSNSTSTRTVSVSTRSSPGIARSPKCRHSGDRRRCSDMDAAQTNGAPPWPDDLRVAYIAAWGELTNPTKGSTANVDTKTGPGYSYRYADLAAVLDVVRPVLARHGLALTSDVRPVDQRVEITTTLLHASGSASSAGIVFEYGRGPQAMGSAVTYARRYQLLALLGLATDDDDDGAAATAVANAQPPRPPKPVRPELAEIARLMRELGVDKDDQRSLIEFEIGREFEHADEVTPDEARLVIARLDDRLEAQRVNGIEPEGGDE